jgi:hypothetical protein
MHRGSAGIHAGEFDSTPPRNLVVRAGFVRYSLRCPTHQTQSRPDAPRRSRVTARLLVVEKYKQPVMNVVYRTLPDATKPRTSRSTFCRLQIGSSLRSFSQIHDRPSPLRAIYVSTKPPPLPASSRSLDASTPGNDEQPLSLGEMANVHPVPPAGRTRERSGMPLLNCRKNSGRPFSCVAETSFPTRNRRDAGMFGFRDQIAHSQGPRP